MAIVWALGNLAWSGTSHPELATAAARVERAIEDDLSAWTVARDRSLAEAARAELAGESVGALGDPATLLVLECFRYGVHRHRLVAAMGEAPNDRFHWLAHAADYLLPSPRSAWGGGSVDRPGPAALWAPSPAVLVPVRPLPDWLAGPNPFADAPTL
jgi:hypothetical protein